MTFIVLHEMRYFIQNGLPFNLKDYLELVDYPAKDALPSIRRIKAAYPEIKGYVVTRQSRYSPQIFQDIAKLQMLAVSLDSG